MIEKAINNPGIYFSNNQTNSEVVYIDKKLRWSSSRLSFIISETILKLKWRESRKYVPFMEAFEAYKYEKKTIRAYKDNMYEEYKPGFSSQRFYEDTIAYSDWCIID